MPMDVIVEKQDNHTSIIQFDIPPEQVNQEYTKAWRRMGQRVNIPGFRRGKAPKSKVEEAIGIEAIKQETMDRLFPPLFADAISEHQLDIVAPPRIESVNFDFSAGIKVKALIETRPEITLPTLDNLTLKIIEYTTPENAEEKELNEVINRFTTLEPVVDRAVKETDIVNIDFKGSVGGELIKGGAAKGYRLDLNSNSFIEGFAEMIVGHTLGEDFTINVTFPENYHDANLSGKEASFEIKINEISEKVIPKADDALAGKAGDYQSLEELKAEIANQLTAREQEENISRKQKAVVDYLLENTMVSIPDAMIHRESNLLKGEVEQRLKSHGLTWEKFIGIDGAEKTWASLREDATKRIKTSLIFGAIAKEKELVVTEAEFNQAFSELIATRGGDEKVLMRQLANNANAVQALTDQILSHKIVTQLSEQATFTNIPEIDSDEKSKEALDKNADQDDSDGTINGLMDGEEFDVIDSED
ncbi:MAG: trigger factor [Cyanobacteria bacterium P01_H01_bin.74]